MNKIKVVDEKTFIENQNSAIKYKDNVIEVNENTDIYIEYSSISDIKKNIKFIVNSNSTLNLISFKSGNNINIKTQIELFDNASVNHCIFNNCQNISEDLTVNLNSENTKYNLSLKTLSKNKEYYNINLNHLAEKTVSNLSNSAVNIENGEIVFNINGMIEKGKIKSVMNQNNRIVNLTKNKCVINPNLYIEEYDVVANHSGIIGKFRDDELFYLQTRGIDKLFATKLLISGVLLKGVKNEYLKEKIISVINQNWR